MKKQILFISGIICIYPILLGNFGPVPGTTAPMFQEPDPFVGPLGATALGDHLVISEILYKASPDNSKDAEFIEIYNPTPFNVPLDNYILGEDTGYSDIAVYYNKTSWDPSADEEPFWRFPTGYDINSGKYLVVAKDGAAFQSRFSALGLPTFEVTDTSSAPNMVRITGANAWDWTDDDECILAFDDSGTIRDVDIIVWGAGSWVNRTEAASPSNKGFYNYNECNGSKLPNAPNNDYSFARTDLSAEYKESATSTAYGMPDGSGNYHDETSEDLGASISALQSHYPSADPPGIPEIGIPAPVAIVMVIGILLGVAFLKRKRKEV
ncbi:MAG: lamin tail domain-containing protein [Candidatus Thorarchaeota archaeon]